MLQTLPAAPADFAVPESSPDTALPLISRNVEWLLAIRHINSLAAACYAEMNCMPLPRDNGKVYAELLAQRRMRLSERLAEYPGIAKTGFKPGDLRWEIALANAVC